MAQQQQRKVIQMGKRPKLLKHYKKHKPTETGMHIQYDLTKRRDDPQQTERWLTQRQEPPEISQLTTETADWGQIKKPIQQALQTIYSKDDKHKKAHTRMGEKSKTMEHANRVGNNATTHRNKK